MSDILRGLSGAELLGLAAILGVVVILTTTLSLRQWFHARQARFQLDSQVREAQISADLRRDLSAQGRSLEEIEQLATPASVQQARIDADSRTKQAQIAADLKRDMLARGLSVDEVRRLTEGEDSTAWDDSVALAEAIALMIQDGDLDPDAVAKLIEMRLRFAHRAADGRRQPAPDTQDGDEA